jgi:hypothetical protein
MDNGMDYTWGDKRVPYGTTGRLVWCHWPLVILLRRVGLSEPMFFVVFLRSFSFTRLIGAEHIFLRNYVPWGSFFPVVVSSFLCSSCILSSLIKERIEEFVCCQSGSYFFLHVNNWCRDTSTTQRKSTISQALQAFQMWTSPLSGAGHSY